MLIVRGGLMEKVVNGNRDGARARPVHDSASKSLEWSARALRTLSAGNHTLLRATDETQLVHDMCGVIVDKGGYQCAGVVYAEHDERKSIRWMAWVAMEDGKARSIDTTRLNDAGFTWADAPSGQTAVAAAIRTRAPCVGRDILNNPAYDSPELSMLRQGAINGGYASVTSFPLTVEDKVLGALFMAATEPEAFNEKEVCLLNELADDLAYGISTLRVREQHRAALGTIERFAFYDAQTGLPNRNRLLQSLACAMERARAMHQPLALLHLKVDRFHEISHVLGYPAGDQLVEEMVRRLRKWTRPEHALARIGEACFGLILPASTLDAAVEFGCALSHTLDEPVEVCGVPIAAPVQVAVAPYSDYAMKPEALFRRANAALYHGVSAIDRVTVFAGERKAEHAGRLALMGELRRAIERNELLLYCQPKVEMASRHVVGAEALLRWAHPTHGMVPPARFIKLAEQSGMITSLTNWLLHAALQQVRAWQRAGLRQTLAINLSAYDLHNLAIVRHIDFLLSAWSINPQLIQFELTESALIDDPDAALDALGRLKSLGVELMIDDFGTGYSSLSYLQKFPVDGIKIDQSFIMAMVENADSAAIVRSTIELGHSLNRKVIAEGVEQEAVWQILAAEGCDVAQGYLISTPMPVEEFTNWQAGWQAPHSLSVH
jgi:diguanylate cyclase